MISLVLKLNGAKKRFCFKKRSITLGPKNIPEVDIPLPIESSVIPYAKIEEHNGRYVIQNLANDPNLRFNGLPFGRRTLLVGSVITIHDNEIVIDNLDDLVEERFTKNEAPEKAFDSELATLMKEVESMEIDTTHSKENTTSPASPSSKKAWITTISCVMLLIVGTFFATVYFSSNVKHEEEELKAGQGVADAAMALLYSKLHKIRPPNRNWADPKFLEQILSQIIPKTGVNCCQIDAQGNFKNLPYILRIYTNDDASRFLLVAQPKPSISSWLSPRDSIVIDSTTMELRKIQDVQPLNRIIFNANRFNQPTMHRISTLVQAGTLIPLHKLDHRHPMSQFTPPTELQMVAPGAQNFVYNAPRYHKLTEPILSDALEGAITPKLLQELQGLMKIPNLVFYTTEGVKSAVKSFKNLSDYITSQQLLVGYFTYNPKTHLPSKTELLVMNQTSQEKAKKKVGKQAEAHQPIKIQSELYQVMTKLGSQRKQALRPIAEGINELLYENNAVPRKEFKEQLITHLKEYEKADLMQQRRITGTLRKLYKMKVVEDQEITSKQFMAYVKATGLTPYARKRQKPKRKYNPLIQARGKTQSEEGTQSVLQ